MSLQIFIGAENTIFDPHFMSLWMHEKMAFGKKANKVLEEQTKAPQHFMFVNAAQHERIRTRMEELVTKGDSWLHCHLKWPEAVQKWGEEDRVAVGGHMQSAICLVSYGEDPDHTRLPAELASLVRAVDAGFAV